MPTGFRWSGVSVILCLLLSTCGESAPKEVERPTGPSGADDADRVKLVGFYGADEITFRYMQRLLKSRRIAFEQEGAFGRSVFVSRRDLDSARKLLAAEIGLRDYLHWPESQRRIEPPWQGSDIDLTLTEALAKYPATSIIGKIIRSPDFPLPGKLERLDQVLRIVRVEWRLRDFVTDRLDRANAIQGQVMFLRRIPESPKKVFKGLSEVCVFEPE